MGFHPANLTLRFILEIAALIGIFRMGLDLRSDRLRWVLAFALVLVAMTIWANFRVPGDESAKSGGPYRVSGPVRLLIEVLVFAAGAVGWWATGPRWLFWAYTAALALHHALSYDRIGWLLKVDSSGEPPFRD